MFTAHQLRNWTSPHLQACPWYLECNFGATPPEEKALFLSLKDAMEVFPLMDEFAGLDLDARAKAVKRKELADKKKQRRLEEAERKNEENRKKKSYRSSGEGCGEGMKEGLLLQHQTPQQVLQRHPLVSLSCRSSCCMDWCLLSKTWTHLQMLTSAS